MESIRNFITTFVLMFFAVSLALTYFGFVAFYSTGVVLKIAFTIASVYTIGKYTAIAIARAFDPKLK